MNSRDLQRPDEGTPLEVLPPEVFNTYEHHAGQLYSSRPGLAGRALRPACSASF